MNCFKTPALLDLNLWYFSDFKDVQVFPEGFSEIPVDPDKMILDTRTQELVWLTIMVNTCNSWWLIVIVDIYRYVWHLIMSENYSYTWLATNQYSITYITVDCSMWLTIARMQSIYNM